MTIPICKECICGLKSKYNGGYSCPYLRNSLCYTEEEIIGVGLFKA